MASATSTTSDKPVGITCGKYVRGEGKRCLHYLANGGCALPDELMCVEWLKLNGHRPPPHRPDPGPAKDLFGNPIAAPAAKTKIADPPPAPAADAAPEPAAETRPPLRGLTTEDIESFKALRVEVCLRSEALGEIWLVPAYTGQARKELTPEHAATIARVIDAFPGARVTAFDKQSPGAPPKEGSPA